MGALVNSNALPQTVSELNYEYSSNDDNRMATEIEALMKQIREVLAGMISDFENVVNILYSV